MAPFLGDFETTRDYRIKTSPAFSPCIFIQGASEQTHGLSDTLLSVQVLQAGKIVESLMEVLADQLEQGTMDLTLSAQKGVQTASPSAMREAGTKQELTHSCSSSEVNVEIDQASSEQSGIP